MNRLIKNMIVWITYILLPVLNMGLFTCFLPGKSHYNKYNIESYDFRDNSLHTNNYHNSFQDLPDSAVAKVGKFHILLNDFINRYTDYLIAAGIKDNQWVRTSILTNMINEIALKNYDDNKSILNNDNFMQEIAWTKKQAILGFLKDRDIYAKITVTDAELRQTFIRVNEKIAARHLYASTEEEAFQLYEMLQKGTDFNLLAKHVFSDSLLSNNGGYLGYFTWGDMDPDFENAAFSLNIGEISKPVKTVYGWSIIKLEDRIPNPIITENEYLNKKHHLERVLKIKKKGPEERAYLNRVFDPSNLTFDNFALENLLTDILKSDQPGSKELSSNRAANICLVYNGKKISDIEIKKLILQIPYYYRQMIKTVDNLKDVINGLLIQEKLLAIAHSKGYDKDPLVIKMFDKLSNMVFLKYKREEIINKSVIADSIVKNFYSNNIRKFTLADELNIQEIIILDKSLADSLKGKLDKGADFGQLASIYSVRKWSKENMGVMGFAPLEKYGMLKDKFWNSPLGQLIGPLKIENYFGLFKVLGKKQGNTLNFSQSKAEASKLAKKELQTQLLKDYLETIKKKIPVKVNQDLLFNYKLDPLYSQ